MALSQAERAQRRVARAAAVGAAAHPRRRAGRPVSVVDRADPEILRDIRHEVGNHFHKLYYWADLLAAEDLGEPTGSPSLARSLKAFESFLQTALLYFHGPGEQVVTVSAADVGLALQSILGETGGAIDLDTAPGLAKFSVRIDPERLSTAFRLLGGQLARLNGSGSVLGFKVRLRRVEGVGGADVEVTLLAPRALAATHPAAEVDAVSWAVAGRILQQHGGWLSSVEVDGQGPRTTLRLPLSGTVAEAGK